MTDLAYTISSRGRNAGKVLELLVSREVARGYVDRHAVDPGRSRVALAALKAGEQLVLPGVMIAAVASARHEPVFTHTGVLMVRISTLEGTAAARELLGKAADAALEAAPGIVAIESTGVTRAPRSRKRAPA